MKAGDLPTLSRGEYHYITNLKGHLWVEEALLNTGEVVIAAPLSAPWFVIREVNSGEWYLGKGRTHR